MARATPHGDTQLVCIGWTDLDLVRDEDLGENASRDRDE
jgi:hypothetical protein